MALSTEMKRGGGIYCSPACYHASRVVGLASRFWAKVNKTALCWLWTGANRGGKRPYGVFAIKKRQMESAHRVSWVMHYGAIPEGLYVCHRCDNAACVNPEHLFLGTQKDNIHDMIGKDRQDWSGLEKGRQPRSLTLEMVREIRARAFAEKMPHRKLAAEYGLHRATVSKIIRGRIWPDN